MARISRYQQDKIISQLAPVAQVNNSGEILANTLSDSARQASGTMVAAQNQQYAANQQTNQTLFNNFTYGLRVRQYYKNAADAHKENVLTQSQIVQSSLDLNLRLDDESNTVKEANRQTPHLANQDFRRSSQSLVDNYVTENKLSPEVALAVRKSANSKIESEFASLNTYAYNQKVENLKAADVNTTQKILTNAGSNADPGTLIGALGAIKAKESSLAWLTADEATKKTNDDSQAASFNWMKKLIDTSPKNGKDLLGKIESSTDENSFEGLLAGHLPREQRDTLTSRWEARDREATAKENEDAAAYKEDTRLRIDAERFKVPNDPNVSGETIEKGKIGLMDIRSELLDELKKPGLTDARKKVITGLVEDTSTNIRAIQNEDIQRKNALYTKEQRNYAADTRDYVMQQRGRSETAYQEHQTEKVVKQLRETPEADNAVVSIISDTNKLTKFMYDNKDNKTTVSMKEITQLGDKVEKNRQYLTTPQYRKMKSDVNTLMEVRKAQGEGKQGTVAALLAALHGTTTKPAAATVKDTVESTARRTKLKDIARTYHEIQVRKNPKIGNKALSTMQLRAIEGLAEKDAQRGVDWSDAE